MHDKMIKVGFVGLGLMGGSIAKAMGQALPQVTIVAYDKNKEALALALMEGTINQMTDKIDTHFLDCDYIFLCAPVSFNTAYLKQLKPYLTNDTILTDVGSVKLPIHEEIEILGMESNFIGGHPMTGSEKSGYSSSTPLILENAYYILSPSSRVSSDKVKRLKKLILSLKGIPLILDPKEHDYSTGIVSHLPHILAATLVDFTKAQDTEDYLLKKLAAGGFRDLTRIASSSPTMWQHICLENHGFMGEILDDYIELLTKVRTMIVTCDGTGIHDVFMQAREYRNSLPEGESGAIKKEHTIYCDLADETGGIAAIATVLAGANISIKNIGILHNREFEEGVLQIDFYDKSAKNGAIKALQKKGYIIYEY